MQLKNIKKSPISNLTNSIKIVHITPTLIVTYVHGVPISLYDQKTDVRYDQNDLEELISDVSAEEESPRLLLKDLEPGIILFPSAAAAYAVFVLGRRWLRAEPTIQNDPSLWDWYAKYLFN